MTLVGCAVVSELCGAQVLLSWKDNSNNELGFVIERGLANLLWQEVGTVDANVTKFTDSTILPDILYSYRVAAFNDAGTSAYSNVATARASAVAQANQPPTIGAVEDQVVVMGTSTGALAFTVADSESSGTVLTVTRSSSNTTLVPVANVMLGGSGNSRTVTVTPSATQTGTARITLTVSDGSLSSTESFLVVVNPKGTAPTFTESPRGGTYTAGQSVTLRATATGSGAVTYQWYHNGVAIAGAAKAQLVLPSVQRFQAGNYRVQVTSGGVSIMSTTVSLIVNAPSSSASRLLNLSTRAWCGTGSQVMIPGFVLSGNSPTQMLLRAVGPTLGQAPFNVSGVLRDPQMQLKQLSNGTFVDRQLNRDWGAAPNVADLRTVFAQLFAFGLLNGSNDAAILADLAPGQYTVVVNDENAGTGVCLLELYDAGVGNTSATLVNYSNRGYVGDGGNVMITGFVVAPEGPLTILLRAVGPALARSPFNVSGVLGDPVIDVFGPGADGAQTLLFSNDNWSAGPDSAYTAQVTSAVGAFALTAGARDAAFVVTLPPGAYTAVARGVNGARGVALMELYVRP